MSSILSINISDKKGVKKTSIDDKVYLRIDHGIEGDAHAGNWHRQVSLLDDQSFERMKAMGLNELKFGDFAENITTEGITLFELPIGTKMKIGEALVEVTQIGKECHTGCAIKQQTGDCVMPREGIFVKVLSEGFIKKGDLIEIVS